MRNQNVICIIPIRSKSKSIKHKNIKMLAGFPLSVYAIKAASNCKLFKKIIIAVDNFSYKKKLQKYIFDKRVSFFKRSLNSSKDNSPTEVVISEVLKKNTKYDHSCLIQATSPLLKDDDIILGYKKYLNGKYDSLISGYITKKFFWKNIKKGIKPINYNPSKRPMRQTNKGTIVENGAFYFFRTNGFFKKKNRIFGRTGVYLMDEKNSIDIDTKSDFEQAKKILNRGK